MNFNTPQFNKRMRTSSVARTVPLMITVVISVLISQFCAAAAPQNTKAENPGKGPQRWEQTIRKFESMDKETPVAKGAMLLIGGSNARRWTDVAKYFPGQQVINRGFGGARLTDVLHFTDRIVLPYAPKTILLNAGGNDLAAGSSPEQVGIAARAFIKKVHAVLPDTRIICIGLPAVRRASSTPESLAGIRAMNQQLAQLAKEMENVEFIDLYTAFLGKDSPHRPELFVEDGTHFNPNGYEILANLIRGKN